MQSRAMRPTDTETVIMKAAETLASLTPEQIQDLTDLFNEVETRFWKTATEWVYTHIRLQGLESGDDAWDLAEHFVSVERSRRFG